MNLDSISVYEKSRRIVLIKQNEFELFVNSSSKIYENYGEEKCGGSSF